MRMFRRTKRKPVAVLGAGPSGLLAAYAAMAEGYEPIIISQPAEGGTVAKSELHGCQYLHAPVPSPDLAGTSVMVDYRLNGTSDGYRDKVYEGNRSVTVSPDVFGDKPHQAWDLRAMYDQLWERLEGYMRPMDVSPAAMVNILDQEWERVFVTIPASTLCIGAHRFESQLVWAIGQRTGSTDFPFQCPENTVVCDGTRDVGWYRMSNVFGHTTVEWARDRKPPIQGVVAVRKPVETNCDCWVDDKRVRRLGRFGKWEKRALVHHAYYEAGAALS